ncbi:MAG: hypothetical protein A3B89_00845 [Candidatus Buchananbacteria bacterium RIFCSPHIGHO2_02_FULL_40_13]|uniref:Uncharacterized protein n=1 Tax=Candidatus Buchananbacteria bacterium RIFCSPLOWO2_01_FULL_39_33 TaxID=1797543 RepID=A0A1G1YH23_9BACT|nr:MAG: hypothetical protein A2820_00910 [Candidatus Buchananbacteria bacterium RIFCSPHIGHO2_01_FULL_40_35]OGY50421.1 MAG: hypothetical protein A3B89_00845 [Candidatus Buchananbacteria bacterium RIFCSPHIGHO2_02_FULL_40_13]OGY51561.1 MAG: hypothetical protein A3A02_02000 [Candidatus Buchananbacteria bacterium RIFCSPLOWO2_01_FULL_39_33]
MESDLVLSLKMTQKILDTKRSELRLLTTILQENKALDDELVTVLAELCNQTIRQIKALESVIVSLEKQKGIFGKTGLPKELKTIPDEEYPESQRRKNI